MTPEDVLIVFRDGLHLTIVMVVAVVLPGLLVGLVVSVLQAATQINEQTLSFLPRLLATFIAMGVAGAWLLSLLIEFATRLYRDIPFLIG